MKTYPLKDAIELLKNSPKLKFTESVDISINLGIDTTKSDQNVRGSSALPHGIGKPSVVVVFAEGQDAKAAQKAGANKVGFEDLIEEIFGELQDEFDIDTMSISADTTNRIALHADMLISDVNEYLGIDLSTTSSGTIGSLVQKQVMHSPKIGDEIVIRPSLIKMRIEDMEGTKVTKLSVSVSDATHTIHPSEDRK